MLASVFFSFHVTAITEIYTLSYTTLFRSNQDEPADGRIIRHVVDASAVILIAVQRRVQPLIGKQVQRAHPKQVPIDLAPRALDRKSTRLNSSHLGISYAVFCLKKKKKKQN